MVGNTVDSLGREMGNPIKDFFFSSPILFLRFSVFLDLLIREIGNPI
jgi:hypothetical protein